MFILKNFVLRFPIPDFRPPHDIQRIPWWKRHVRSDFLLLKLHHANAHTLFQTNQLSSKYSLQCLGIDVFYYESAHSDPFVIAKVTSDAGGSCELDVEIHPVKKGEIEMEPAEREIDMTQSIYGSLPTSGRNSTGPFSSKRIIHESDTPHARETQGID